jgi:hypothetical protein
MKRISLFAIIPAFLLMTSCAPILTGNGNNVPNENDEERMRHGFPTLRDRDGEPYFFNDGSPSRPVHDNDRQHDQIQVQEVHH